MEPAYAYRIKKAFPDLDVLFSAGEYVGSLLGHPGWRSVQGLVEAEIADIDAQLDGPRSLSHVEYAHLHGQRRGLKASAELAEALHACYVAELERQREKHEGVGESMLER